MRSRNPFIYPGAIHRRALSPGPFRAYRTYLPHLRAEFKRQCVYCRKPDSLAESGAFGVDHYRPQTNPTPNTNSYSNLFYACNQCNRAKTNLWPSLQGWRAGAFIPNPCRHVMLTHLKYVGSKVVDVTRTGKFTIKQLRLNSPRSIAFRERYQGIVDAQHSVCRNLMEVISELESEMAKSNQVRRQRLQLRKQAREKQLEGVLDEIEWLMCRLMEDPRVAP